ncbi:MAG: repressor LexA [Deltaproteobacteria bacterium]|nr:repressor LexA [Deltaproteobacteria bacterium]
MTPKTPPGQTRHRVYHFVRKRLLEGRPPTVREVQAAFGFRSVQTARAHLETLVSEGKLIKEASKARGYRLPEVGQLPAPALVPLLGQVQAGTLTTAVEDPEGYVAVQYRHGQETLFALRVRGRSMTGAGILPGDVVIVRQQPSADPGDIVVAMVDDEATVKRLRVRKNRVELHPENPHFKPIVPETGDLVLLGKVIEVRRYLENIPALAFIHGGHADLFAG